VHSRETRPLNALYRIEHVSAAGLLYRSKTITMCSPAS